MPDYSGYAQRPQQDPNLAAWAQIGGNLANIFGLDPAKAAEARRGLQQEQYNEERRLAQERQTLANKRIGQLISGSGFDKETGEFSDPAAWAEFVQNMAEMGDARQAVPFAPGRYARTKKDEIEKNQLAYERQLARQGEIDAKKLLSENQRAETARKQQEAQDEAERTREFNTRLAHGGRDLRFSPEIAMKTFERWRTLGDPSIGLPALRNESDLMELDPATNQWRVHSRGMEWMNKAGLKDRNVNPNALSRMEGADYATEKNNLRANIASQLKIPADHPAVTDIVERLYAHQLNRSQNDEVVKAIRTPEELLQTINDVNDPTKAVNTVVIRFPVVAPDGSVTYRYGRYDVRALAPIPYPEGATPEVKAQIDAANKAKREHPQHPANLFKTLGTPLSR
jgi:hypothetical protein